MCINNFNYIDILKYRSILAYFHTQLEYVENKRKKGIYGQVCTKDPILVRETMLRIKEKIENVKCTKKHLQDQIKNNPMLVIFYDLAADIVAKHFTVNTVWMPSFLMLEVLRLFAEKGYNYFKEINFEEIQAQFELHEDRKNSMIPLHYKCAEEIFLTLEQKKIFRKRRRK